MRSAQIIPFPGTKPAKTQPQAEAARRTTIADEIMAHSKATGRKIKAGGMFQALFLAGAIARLADEAGGSAEVVSLRDAALRTLGEIVEEGVYA